jgi:glycosyltransferase involved in cell wall biosynthesis
VDEIVVIIPTLNEEASIGGVLRALPEGVRAIVVDGGSGDATVSVAASHGAQVVTTGRGYGRACLAGAEAAPKGSILVFMDGDGADDPSSLTVLAAPVRADEADLVLASRVMGEREAGSMALHQVAAGLVIGGMIRLLYGTRYTDMCAFRAIRRETLLALGMNEMTYGWNLEMQMKAARAGLRIREIPVAYRRRSGGESKVAGSLKGTLRAGSRIVATFVRIAAHG